MTWQSPLGPLKRAGSADKSQKAVSPPTVTTLESVKSIRVTSNPELCTSRFTPLQIPPCISISKTSVSYLSAAFGKEGEDSWFMELCQGGDLEAIQFKDLEFLYSELERKNHTYMACIPELSPHCPRRRALEENIAPMQVTVLKLTCLLSYSERHRTLHKNTCSAA